ncbi:sigma-70 family RNA polymerase sigma factor [Salinivibrio sp. IB282]|uniref:sigma-70 family RNA polymerase sigma factor n=1 Tax=Salinivibrio sp. IB282 TaxID=1766122 RepID=UPI0009887D03|nr:sigma-70 family RNA polymerase sigma factor [Salinivibrio sp. IB282]OOE64055.1 hypothetical protein BZG14_08010 [Salinivibrio sp. IB282]
MTSQLSSTSTTPCLLEAWRDYESLLYRWLIKQTHDDVLSADVLQETFLKALQQNEHFCAVQQPRAWLYRTAHHLLIDRYRKQSKTLLVADPEPLPESYDAPPAITGLMACLPKALRRLPDDQRDVIEQCDLGGVTQRDYADAHQLSLPAVKSRIQRARQHLREILLVQCNIQFDDHNRVCCHLRDSD